jgi:predicted nucleic acid binding AN1-type Zn finger protein
VRCQAVHCGRKVDVVRKNIICACQKQFCASHAYYKNHDCTADWKAREQELSRTNGGRGTWHDLDPGSAF